MMTGQSYGGAGGSAQAFMGVASGGGGRASGGFTTGGVGVSSACACPKPAERTAMQKLLDHCIAEARDEHGPKLLDPTKIYEDMAKRVLAAMLAGLT